MGALPFVLVAAVGAEGLVSRALEAHGSESVRTGHFTFDFRGDRFSMRRNEGVFRFDRWTEDGWHHVLDNRGFRSFKNETPSELPPQQARAAAEALNSVVYFASLPLPLADPAVRAKRLPDQRIAGVSHPVIEVRFDAEGGGTDHRDVFRYWFDPHSGRIRFLAYKFETNGGGVRLRMLERAREVGGATFVDWKNYGSDDAELPLEDLPEMAREGKLPHLSTIELENVRRLPDR